MHVYDFDGTLYRGDSTRDFALWCARRYPRVRHALPRAGLAGIVCFGLHAIDKTQFKSELYRFLRHVPDIQRDLKQFWQEREILTSGPCYPQPGDLVISAGPEFLLRDVCEQRELELIASRVDSFTGAVLGPNCSNEEKVRRFREAYPNATIERFFSDSHNDDPLARLAERAFLVDLKHGAVEPWPK